MSEFDHKVWGCFYALLWFLLYYNVTSASFYFFYFLFFFKLRNKNKTGEYVTKLNVQALLEEWISTRIFKDKCLVQVLMIVKFILVPI
jgi:hypothetical protein